jgi:hypothetical protein
MTTPDWYDFAGQILFATANTHTSQKGQMSPVGASSCTWTN